MGLAVRHCLPPPHHSIPVVIRASTLAVSLRLSLILALCQNLPSQKTNSSRLLTMNRLLQVPRRALLPHNNIFTHPPACYRSPPPLHRITGVTCASILVTS